MISRIIEIFMKDFERLRQECFDELAAVGIVPGQIVSWTVNRRAKTRWGLCKRTSRNPDKFLIEIASALLSDDRISEKACKETIIHEILHTCEGGSSHTGVWKQYAELMNTTYGYNIKRVTSGEEKGVENYRVVKPRSYKYMFKCKYCGHMLYYKRDSKFTHYYSNYLCCSCGRSRAYTKYLCVNKEK